MYIIFYVGAWWSIQQFLLIWPSCLAALALHIFKQETLSIVMLSFLWFIYTFILNVEAPFCGCSVQWYVVVQGCVRMIGSSCWSINTGSFCSCCCQGWQSHPASYKDFWEISRISAACFQEISSRIHGHQDMVHLQHNINMELNPSSFPNIYNDIYLYM